MPLRFYQPYTVNEPKIHPSEASTLSWTSPTGRVTSLSDFGNPNSGICIAPGAIGLGMPDINYQENESPTFDGSVIRSFRSPARQIDLPIQMWGSSRLDLLARYHRLITDMKPSKVGPGLLSLRRFDGDLRQIEAYYVDGLKGQDDDEAWGLHWIRAVISLRCPKPFWLGTDHEVSFDSIGNGENDQPGEGDETPITRTLFFPILPLVLAGGLPVEEDPEDDEELIAVGQLEVDNPGDVPALPVITITGPCDEFTIQNDTTGEQLSLNNGVDAGKTVVIDTRERARTVIEYTPGSSNLPGEEDTPAVEVNRFNDLGDNSTFFELDAGMNVLTIAAPGVNPDTHLKITYTSRYYTGY